LRSKEVDLHFAARIVDAGDKSNRRAVLSAMTVTQKPGEPGFLLGFRHYRRAFAWF